jgi:hypothetical protein
VEQTAKALSAADTAPKQESDVITIEDQINEQVIEQLKNVDINTLSPYECMSFLFDIKKRLM